MTIVAHIYSFVIGVDTHARTHTLAIVAGNGELIDQAQFPATVQGIARAIAWSGRRTDGIPDTMWAIEGIGVYGAHIAHAATEAGYFVVEAPRVAAPSRRGTGKSDPLDARAIAEATLAQDLIHLRHPRDDAGARAALRILVTAREQMTHERTINVNALTALARSTPLGLDARKPLTKTQIGDISRWRTRHDPIAIHVARSEATRLAQRITDLDNQLRNNRDQITELIQQTPAAPLLTKPGIGPVTAAQTIIVWSHPGRIRSEAAFAAIAGVNPIPASSGNTTRHRLNHGGDRHLNQALHMATIVRMTHDPETRAYVDKRHLDGKTDREIRRCLKRYLARQLYRTLNTLYTTPTTT